MKKLLYIVLLSIVGFSCIKKEYDLDKELDLSMKIGGDYLYIPIGSTDTIFLKKFLKADEVDMLEEMEDGGYGLIMRDSTKLDVPAIDTTQLRVDDIVESRHEGIDFSSVLDFPDIDLGTAVDASLNIATHLYQVSAVPSADFSIISEFLPLRMRDTVELSFSSASLPDMVQGIESVSLGSGSKIQMTLTAANLPGGAIMTVDTLRLQFPRQIQLDQNDPAVSGQTYFVEGLNISGMPTPISVPITHLDLSTTPLDADNRLVVDEEIQIFTKFKFSGTYSNDGSWPTTEENDTRFGLQITSSLTFGSATVKLNRVEESLPRTTVPIDIAANDIPSEIVSLDSIILQNTQVRLALNISQTQIGGKSMNTHVEVKFPQNIMFNSSLVSAANVYEDNIVFNPNGEWSTTLNVRGLKLGAGQLSGGSININDSITFEASVIVDNPIINTDTLLRTNLSVDVEAAVTNIKFGKVYGRVNPDIPAQDISVNLSDLPDMLKNDSIVLDVKPYLDLAMKTNLQIPFEATVVMKPYKNGSIVAGGRQEVKIEVPASPSGVMQTKKFWIAATDALMPVGQGYVFKEFDLGAVVKHIPDSIQIHVEAGIDQNQQAIFDLNAQYQADLDYNFVVPFAFGPDLQVTIKDTIEVPENVGEYMSGNNIGLSGTIWNSIPLDLIATITPVDENNRPIVGIESATLTIKAGTNTGAAVESVLDIAFNDPNKKLSDMRGILVVFTGRTGANAVGVPIKPDNFIKVMLNAKLIDGMTIDLNDLNDSE